MQTSQGKIKLRAIKNRPAPRKSIIKNAHIIDVSLDEDDKIYRFTMPYDASLFLAQDELLELHYIEAEGAAEIIGFTPYGDGVTYLIQHPADTKKRLIIGYTSVVFIVSTVIALTLGSGDLFEIMLISIVLPLFVCACMLLIPMSRLQTGLAWKTWREVRRKLARSGKLHILRWF